MGRKSSGQDKSGEEVDKAKSCIKEAGRLVTGDEEKKAERSADQTKGIAK